MGRLSGDPPEGPKTYADAGKPLRAKLGQAAWSAAPLPIYELKLHILCFWVGKLECKAHDEDRIRRPAPSHYVIT
jgi:hypothetical protein